MSKIDKAKKGLEGLLTESVSHKYGSRALQNPIETPSRLIADVWGWVVQDGHAKKVRESLKPGHYDYKNLLFSFGITCVDNRI